MRLANSVDEFVRAPIGKYVLGRQSLVWCATAQLCGTAVWGRAEAEEVRRVTRAWDFEARMAVPYDSVVDLQHITGVDPVAFSLVADELRARLPRLAHAVRRQALVRPPGLPGALVAGFYPALEAGHEWGHFADDAAAFTWLGIEAAATFDEVRRIIAEGRAEHPLLGHVRALLTRAPAGEPTLAHVADELGVSARTLQRELTKGGTSFRLEVRRARVELACGLLVDSDEKMDAIASTLGFAGASAFVTFFRRATGESPSAYRKNRRR